MPFDWSLGTCRLIGLFYSASCTRSAENTGIAGGSCLKIKKGGPGFAEISRNCAVCAWTPHY